MIRKNTLDLSYYNKNPLLFRKSKKRNKKHYRGERRAYLAFALKCETAERHINQASSFAAQIYNYIQSPSFVGRHSTVLYRVNGIAKAAMVSTATFSEPTHPSTLQETQAMINV